MRELAARSGYDRHYAAQILRLAVLSPQMTDAIHRGEHSSLLTVVQLTKIAEMDWGKQSLSV